MLNLNFEEGYDYTQRLFEEMIILDQFNSKHLVPLYLSKITNPDTSILQFDEDGQPIRGIRTFGEIAHYIRCIPFEQRDHIGKSDNSMWASPDFTLTKKVGTEIDHALLMASIFRTVKQEDLTEFTKFVKEMKKKT